MSEKLSEIDEKLLHAETPEETKYALEHGANVNAKDTDGQTALMKAYTTEQVRLLIEAGADVNAKDKNGKTALMQAVFPEQVKLLIEAGADVNAKDNQGRTALEIFHDQELGQSYWTSTFRKVEPLIKNADEIYKKAQYDKAGLKIDNKMAIMRSNMAKTIDEKLGTNVRELKLPEWAKKAEAYMARSLETAKKKLRTTKSKQTTTKGNEGR